MARSDGHLFSSPQRPYRVTAVLYGPLNVLAQRQAALPFVLTGLSTMTGSQVEDGFCLRRTHLSLRRPSLHQCHLYGQLDMLVSKSRFYRPQLTGDMMQSHYLRLLGYRSYHTAVCMEFMWFSDIPHLRI